MNMDTLMAIQALILFGAIVVLLTIGEEYRTEWKGRR